MLLALLAFGCSSGKQLTATEGPPPGEAPAKATTAQSQPTTVTAVEDDSTSPADVTEDNLGQAGLTTTRVSDALQGSSRDEMKARSTAEFFALPVAGDTLREGLGDTTTIDSARLELMNTEYAVDNDSIATAPETEESELDTTIYYGGRELLFDVKTRSSIIRGNARVQYKSMTLAAYEILVDWEDDLMTAVPKFDTLWVDSAQTLIDTVKIIGMPTFKQGSTTMNGMLMRVNMKNKAGYVEGGSTKYGDGWYKGQRIQKVSDDVFFVQDGSFTSCDLEHPHFHFYGAQMKMIRGDKVVGKPVVLEFGDVPVAALPFSVFSIRPGRHSGILIPTYGDDSQNGRSLQNFGYYWAASPYWDVKTILDYREERGFRLRSNLIYKKKNSFNGSISGSYELARGEYTAWSFSPTHNQQFNKYTSLRINGDFVSNNNFYKEQSTNYDQQLKQRIQSNATYRTRIGQGTSLTINLNQTKNLVSGNSTEVLPNFSMNFGSHQLFPTEESRRSSDKNLIYTPPQERIAPGEERPEDPDRWYNRITYTYNNRGKYTRDTRHIVTNDYDSPMTTEEEGFISHNFSVQAPQKVLKYITLSPSMRYTEDWLFEQYNWRYDSTGTAVYTKDEGFFQRREFSTGISSNTKFYGMFPVGHWGIEMLRHVVSPSVSLNWRPDFSDREWGYYDRISGYFYDAENDTTIYKSDIRDKYYQSAAGGTGSGRSLATSFSLGNLFQMKTLTVDAEGKEKEQKLDLFKVDLSSSYNFIADSLNFSNLSTRISSSPLSSGKKLGPLNRLSLDLTMRHSFYEWDRELGKEVSRFYAGSESAGNGALLRLTQLRSTASFSMTLQNPLSKRKAKIVFDQDEPDTADVEDFEVQQLREQFESKFNDFGDTQSPVASRGAKKGGLDLSGSLAYTLNRRDPDNVTKSLFLNGNLSFKLTPNWSFRYNTGVDLITREVNVGTLSVERDLHCWTMRFTWRPTGIGDGIFLYIGVKASMLKDLNYKHKTGSGGPSF